MSKHLGRYILWNGKPANIVSDTSGERFIGIKLLEPDTCPHCHGLLEQNVFDVVYGSPYWNENAKPIPTLYTPHPNDKEEN